MDNHIPILVLYVAAFLFVSLVSSSAASASESSLCPHESDLFRNSIRSQCPISIYPNPALEVDGDALDRMISSKQRNEYTSVLLYASWCPFSRDVRSKFEKLSSMFPQIEHLAVEHSSALPSVFSRYGVHSLPSILMINQTSRIRYHGPKDLRSLAQFYMKTTGVQPIQYLAEDEQVSLEDNNTLIMLLWNGSSTKEIMKLEPYLVCAILFLCLRGVISLFPEVLSRLEAFCVSYVPHLKLEIFGETSQLFGRVLHMIDVRRIWTKIRLSKTRNFHQSAKNARVWASSLASVSMGETSSARSST